MTTGTEPAAPNGIDRPNTWRRAGTAITVLLFMCGVAGVAYVWSIDPVWGRGLQILVTYAIVVLSLLIALGWMAAFSTFRWRTILAAVAIVLTATIATAASVRSVEFSGDMQLILNFRWSPTSEERLRAHHRAQDAVPAISSSVGQAPVATSEDVPAYRGHHRDGVIEGPPLSRDWQQRPPTELWRQPCGGGYASFSIVGDRLVTLEQRANSEAVVCYDAATGRQQWVHEYPALFTEALGGPGPRATPTIDDGTVFSFGALGDLVALDLVTGAVRWSKDLLPDGLPVVEWGLCSSPLVVGEQILVEVGGPAGDGLVSVQRDTGDLLWQRPGVDRLREPGARNRAGYSSPSLVTIDGVDQVLMFDGEGLRSYAPQTGQLLWFAPFRNDAGVSVAQPLVLDGGRVFLAMSYGVGCRMIHVSRTGDEWHEPEVLWDNLHMKCKFTSPVLHEGFLYGLDEGILVCLDPETGERRWKGGASGTRGRFYHGQIVISNGLILGLTERGDLVLVEATPDEYRELGTHQALDARKVWNPPTLSRGIVYARNHEEMAAFDLRANP
ncbi:MAG: PQQ-like beta-propeller repeat protein [Planctomycetaceae bacterium]|nr:PQQ-like beta-propeller repeat protein [Planctomycetaceae bacterium]